MAAGVVDAGLDFWSVLAPRGVLAFHVPADPRDASASPLMGHLTVSEDPLSRLDLGGATRSFEEGLTVAAACSHREDTFV